MRPSALFIFLLFLLSPLLRAQQPLIHLREGDGQPRHVAQLATYFLDTTARLSIEEVTSPQFLERFIPSGAQQLSIGVTSSVCWVRLRIVTEPGSGPWCLNPEPAFLDDIRLYRKTAAGWKVSKSGINYPAGEREMEDASVIFPLHQSEGDTEEYFLRIESSYPMIILLRAGPVLELWEEKSGKNVLNGVFFGIMLLMALYNLFLFLTNRDRVYLYYVLYVVFSAIFISFSTGYYAFLPDFIRRISNFNHVTFPFLFGLFGLLFTMRFLHTKKFVPRLHTAIIIFAVIVFLVLLVDFFSHHLSTVLIQLMGVLLTVICISVGVAVYRAGYSAARYYLLGFGVYTLGLSIYIVLGVAKIDTAQVSPDSILMGSSAIEIIILSFAIGDKLNAAVREKQAAQEKTVEALRVNEQLVREQNVVLERKVEERTHEIQQQKAIIEEKNKDILSSIHYAKRIQRALLASDSLLDKNLAEYFVLYRPKDIVSGDFYWAHETGDGRFLLLAGDCTGHGVPGAFMSLLNISILHELTTGRNITRPDLVLNAQREAIIMALNPDGAEEHARDGMDAVLCSFDMNKLQLSFACANNPLWLLREGNIVDHKGDKQPIGAHEGHEKPFTLRHLQLLRGDTVYLLTDGFADQFGGPAGKKFKYRQLQEKIVAMGNLPMPQQKVTLEKLFDDWKGDLEQVDDVLVIGIRIV